MGVAILLNYVACLDGWGPIYVDVVLTSQLNWTYNYSTSYWPWARSITT